MDHMRADAQTIWNAAIAAVQPERLVAERLSAADLELDGVDRILVVGGGKAAAGMAAGVEALLGKKRLARHRVTGLVSVPAGCGRRLAHIEVRETRPAAANLPTPDVVRATREMLAAVAALGPRDLAIAVITGGGSALLAAPPDGVSLEEKIALTRRLSAAGADIATLNAARRKLSLVKGGGLARACAAGRLLAVVLSDVMGNDLDVIASGPCMPPEHTSPGGAWTTPIGCHVEHIIVGDNATAAEAAAATARQIGYAVIAGSALSESSAEATGKHLAADALALMAAANRDGRPRAIIAGGEATVTVPADHGKGGRNQQTVLAAIAAVRSPRNAWPAGLLVASIGTDGEDGPTDAAGAFADAGVIAAIGAQSLDVSRTLARCDAYSLFEKTDGLIRTGPTGTNVADVRIVLAR